MGLTKYDRIESRLHNTGLAKVAVQCSANTFVVKITTFAKPGNIKSNLKTKRNILLFAAKKQCFFKLNNDLDIRIADLH